MYNHSHPQGGSLDNQRAIMLQITIYKMYAAIIGCRVSDWARSENIISPSQKDVPALRGMPGTQLCPAKHTPGLELDLLRMVGLHQTTIRVIKDINDVHHTHQDKIRSLPSDPLPMRSKNRCAFFAACSLT